MGYQPDFAANGFEVLHALELKTYDLIFMDLQMPEMDGMKATHAIIDKYANTDQMPVIIAMTANAMQGDRENCLANGMHDYISKPIALEAIEKAVEKWFPAQNESKMKVEAGSGKRMAN